MPCSQLFGLERECHVFMMGQRLFHAVGLMTNYHGYTFDAGGSRRGRWRDARPLGAGSRSTPSRPPRGPLRRSIPYGRRRVRIGRGERRRVGRVPEPRSAAAHG